MGVSSSSMSKPWAHRCLSGKQNVVRYFSYRNHGRIPNLCKIFMSATPSVTRSSISSRTLCALFRRPCPATGLFSVNVTLSQFGCRGLDLDRTLSVRIRSSCPRRFRSFPGVSNTTFHSCTRLFFPFIGRTPRCFSARRNPRTSLIRSLISVSRAIFVFLRDPFWRFVPPPTSFSIADAHFSSSLGDESRAARTVQLRTVNSDAHIRTSGFAAAAGVSSHYPLLTTYYPHSGVVQ